MEILAQNYAFERCGESQHTLELEAAHLSLIVLAYFPILEEMETWERYPVYLAEADCYDIEKGWDKAGHFFTAAMASFEYRYSVERGLGEYVTWHLVASALAPIGANYWAAYEHEAIFGKLLEPDLWEPLPPRFNDYHDFQAYMAVAIPMAAFEVVTTAPVGETAEQYLEAIKHLSTKPVTHGLVDPGTFRDMTANLRGAKFGIQVYHNPSQNSIPYIEGDEGIKWGERMRNTWAEQMTGKLAIWWARWLTERAH
jgi:hypothetical protein